MRKFGLVLAALVPIAASTAAAEENAPVAPLPCHDYKSLVTALDKRYGEAPVSLGMQNNGHALQVFASAESGSWTVLSVAPDGTGCIVAAGRHWQTRKAGTSDPAA